MKNFAAAIIGHFLGRLAYRHRPDHFSGHASPGRHAAAIQNDPYSLRRPKARRSCRRRPQPDADARRRLR